MPEVESRRRIGRPSKGDRHAFHVRIQRRAADLVIAEAEARGMSRGDYIEALVVRSLGFDVVLPDRIIDNPRQQELGISA